MMSRFFGEMFREMELLGNDYGSELNNHLDWLEGKHERLEDDLLSHDLNHSFVDDFLDGKSFQESGSEFVVEKERIESEVLDVAKQQNVIETKLGDLELFEKFDNKVREESDYWADKGIERLKQINEADARARDRYEGASPKFWERHDLENSSDWWSKGMTPDFMGEMMSDLNAAKRLDPEYFVLKDNLKDLLDYVDQETAEGIMDQAIEDGRIGEGEVGTIKATVRNHYNNLGKDDGEVEI